MTVSAGATLAFYIFGAGAVLQDWSRSQVSNRWILAGLAAAAAGYSILALGTVSGLLGLSWLGHGRAYFSPLFYGHAAIHCLLAMIAAVALWQWRVWPAGDAKLYVVLLLLMALMNYQLWGFPWLPFLATLVNIFVAAAGFVLAVMGWELLLRARGASFQRALYGLHAFADRLRKRAADEWPKRRNYAVASWNIFALFFLGRALPELFRSPAAGPEGALMAYLLMYVFWDRLGPWVISKDVARLSFFAVSLVALPALLILHQGLAAACRDGVEELIGFGMFLPVMRRFADYYLVETRKIPIRPAELKEGMILAGESWRRLRAAAPEEEMPTPYADGLSAEDVGWVRERSSGLETNELVICRHRPFAFWIMLGCLWSLYERQNLVLWLISRFHPR